MNRWLGIPLGVAVVVAVAAVLVRAAWGELLIWWELRRPVRVDEVEPFEREGV